MHVNASAPSPEPRAFGNFFNPSTRTLTSTIDLPVYYAGLRRGSKVKLSWGGSLLKPSQWPQPPDSTQRVREDDSLRVTLEMAPRSFLWAVLRPAA